MQESVDTLLAEKLDNYFGELQRCGGVPPAVRYRLEGFLQALQSSGLCTEAQLREAVDGRIKTFNSAGQVTLQPGEHAWQLPCVAPLAPVKPSGDS